MAANNASLEELQIGCNSKPVCMGSDIDSEATKFEYSGESKSLVKHTLENFSPAYFVNVMATGISAAILYNFPYEAQWLRILLYIMWGLCIFFLFSGCIMMVCACWMRPKLLLQLHTDPRVAPFMGCFAMGYNLCVNMLYFVTGESFIIGIFVLWWISVFFCIYSSFIVFYFTFLSKTKCTKHTPTENLHATMLLPIVALTVTSSAGQLFALSLPSLRLQILTVIVSYVLWANAMAMSFIVLTLIFYKYIVHKVPDSSKVFTSFIPIGFLGQGAFSILLCGHNWHTIISSYPKLISLPFADNTQHLAPLLANISLIVCSFTGLFLISFGYFNTFVAVITVITKVVSGNTNPEQLCHYNSGWKRVFNGSLKYHKGFWAMTFPLGTMAISNVQLGKLFAMPTFKVIGAMYGVATVLVTVGCFIGFVYKGIQDARKIK